VSEDAGVPKGLDAELEVGYRAPGKGFLREEEPGNEAYDESDCMNHEDCPH
jgi:hypothetical protein